jgi:hypothetical protein
MNTESIAAGPAPALDGTSAAEAATAPGAASGETPDAGAPPSTDPSVDENLVFIQEDGFQTTYFALDCRSLAEDGSSIDGATNTALPVDGGYTLECSIERFPSRATTNLVSAANEVWCALGELTSYEPGGDDRLTITIVTPPDVAPATLIATRDGEENSLAQATVFGSRIWPLWIEASYDVVDLARAEQGKTCDQSFGL